MSDSDAAAIARTYIGSVGGGELAVLDALFDDGLVATISGDRYGKAEWIDALRRLLPILVRNDVREIFVAGERACVVYDFVTDTPAGSVVCVELLTVRNARITEIELVFDRVAFAPVHAALRERTPAQ